jgi:hypothetical protein
MQPLKYISLPHETFDLFLKTADTVAASAISGFSPPPRLHDAAK